MYPLRSITFVAELLHPRIQHGVELLQRVHSRTFGEAEARYTNFQVVPAGGVLSNPVDRPGAQSTVTLVADRVRIQEQNTGISREDFERRVQTVAQIAQDELRIAQYVAQQYVIQSLVNPRNSVNAEQYMRGSVFNLRDDRLAAFGREPDLLGMRLRFPAPTPAEGLFQLRVENYHQDPRSLFLENVGVFQRRIDAEPAPVIAKDLQATYAFLDGPVMEMIAGLDGREHDHRE